MSMSFDKPAWREDGECALSVDREGGHHVAHYVHKIDIMGNTRAPTDRGQCSGDRDSITDGATHIGRAQLDPR